MEINSFNFQSKRKSRFRIKYFRPKVKDLTNIKKGNLKFASLEFKYCIGNFLINNAYMYKTG